MKLEKENINKMHREIDENIFPNSIQELKIVVKYIKILVATVECYIFYKPPRKLYFLH